MRKSLSIIEVDGVLYDISLTEEKGKTFITVLQCKDAKQFFLSNRIFSLISRSEQSLPFDSLSFVHISKHENGYAGVFGFGDSYFIAYSADPFSWEIDSPIHMNNMHGACVVSGYQYQNRQVLYWADTAIHLGLRRDDGQWEFFDDPIFDPRIQKSQSLQILQTFVGVRDIFVVYSMDTLIGEAHYFALSLAIFSKEDPRKIAWRLSYPLWSVPEKYVDKVVAPVAVVAYRKKIYSFWLTADGGILNIIHALFEQIIFDEHKGIEQLTMGKHADNPMLKANPIHAWESRAVFNPAALYDEEKKKLHMLYRAVGDDWTSVLGYAVSQDGTHVDMTSACPAYIPRMPFEGVSASSDRNSPYASGPGIGGCEDPRMTCIGDTVYLTYVAFNGYSGPRVALSSLSYDDFSNQRWNWSEPVIISKPGVIDKSACIFPEKINGKYAVMHRVFPHILIDFVDSLDFDGETFLQGEFHIAPSTNGWDSRKVGAGPPPIKTPYGWLLIYHAVDDKRDYEYQIGAMLLDLTDPTKVLYRSTQPIIRPTQWYENSGHKAGVVYPCGAAVIDDTLHVYYGGADTYVCTAQAPLSSFLSTLMQHHPMHMQPVLRSL